MLFSLLNIEIIVVRGKYTAANFKGFTVLLQESGKEGHNNKFTKD